MLTHRLLTVDDTQAIKDIVEIFRNQTIDNERAEKFLRDEHVLVYAAFDDTVVCGYVLCYRLPRMDLGNDMFQIYHCFVRDEYKRRHIATNLLTMALDYAKEHNLHYAFLITQNDNEPAKALYSSLGGYNHPKNKELYYWYLSCND